MKKFADLVIAWIHWLWTLPRCYDQERRQSAKHKKKLKLCKSIWIVAGVIIILLLQSPVLAAFAVVVVLATTFLAFIILDETD